MKPVEFSLAVAAARKYRGLDLLEMSILLDVSLHTIRSWLKPAATSRREPPGWASAAMTAIAYQKPVSVVRGGLRVTYEPATKTPLK